MKIVLSRKGFDSASGKVPSPIEAGRPISMPIPGTKDSPATYESIGFGDRVEKISRQYNREDPCHHDPMFRLNECFFGQSDAAQSHLANQGVERGDVFLFFGLFAEEATRERHHRIFGYMRIAEIYRVDAMNQAVRDEMIEIRHPHLFEKGLTNNTIYRGEGQVANHAHAGLRLTRLGGPLSVWTVPPWLREHGLSYHRNPKRWIGDSELQTVGRGQEFVSDLAGDQRAIAWVDRMIALIQS